MRNAILRAMDPFIAPMVLGSSLVSRLVRRAGVEHMPVCKKMFLLAGTFPILDHYYEPLFNAAHLNDKFSNPRRLPGIEWQMERQLGFLSTCQQYKDELHGLPMGNKAFDGADAQFWYSLIRATKPRRVIEIGSGHSTLIAIRALRRNLEEGARECNHICIEPYEMPWLEQSGATIIRKKVEDLPLSFFDQLHAGDILFIDSSHVIRPQGDVVTEVLEILPALKAGVIVHIHDIFSPRHYHYKWVAKEIRLWNEQYLLEAFLSHNSDWEIVAALNYLQHEAHASLHSCCPCLGPNDEPGSIYIRRVK